MTDSILISPDIQKHPSLYQAFLANEEAVRLLDQEIELVKAKIVETKEKLRLAVATNIPNLSIRLSLARQTRSIVECEKQKKAYLAGYLEIPRLQARPEIVEFNNHKYWHFRLNEKTPLRVFQALHKAKESNLFDSLVVFRERGADPIIAGKVGRRYFYVASWR